MFHADSKARGFVDTPNGIVEATNQAPKGTASINHNLVAALGEETAGLIVALRALGSRRAANRNDTPRARPDDDFND